MISQNTDIIKKIKERIPYLTTGSFTLVIKLSNISLNNYTIQKKGEPHISISDFKIYFVCLCILAMTWDLIHTLSATILYHENIGVSDSSNEDELNYEDHFSCYYKIKKFFKKLLFCCLSLIISFLLFLCFTNIFTNGLPLYIFFNFDYDLDILVYGIIFPLIYILHIIEETYLKKYLDVYIDLEKKDDIAENSSLFGGRKRNLKVAQII
jgi:hypothetical protein